MSSHATEQLLYTYQQAAALLGLNSVQALRDMVYRGKGPVPTRIGSRVFFTPADLRIWVDAHRQVPNAGIEAVVDSTVRKNGGRGRPSVQDRIRREAQRTGVK